MAEATKRLARFPRSSETVETRGNREVRRALLPKTQHQLYYVVDDATATLFVVAVWHSAQGDSPLLPR